MAIVFFAPNIKRDGDGDSPPKLKRYAKGTRESLLATNVLLNGRRARLSHALREAQNVCASAVLYKVPNFRFPTALMQTQKH